MHLERYVECLYHCLMEKFFDLKDRTRLAERFFGAARAVLARG